MQQGAWRPGSATIIAIALVAAAAFAAGCGLLGGDDATSDVESSLEPTATPTVPPEEALRLWVQRRLRQSFVADCEEAQRPNDAGKQCASFLGARGSMRAYELGPVFSAPTRLIILQQIADMWTIVHLENRDPSHPQPPGIPWPLRPGATVVVIITDDCLRVREHPGLGARQIDCLENGTEVTISGGPTEIDGLQWWELEGYEGWSASTWLRYPEEATPAPPAVTPEET